MNMLVLFWAVTAGPALAQSTPSPPRPTGPMNSGPAPTNGFEYNQYMHDLLNKSRSESTGSASGLSRSEQRAVRQIEAALDAENYEEARVAINKANAIAETKQAKYAVAALQLQLGMETGQLEIQDKAIDAALESGLVPAALLPTLYKKQGTAALLAKEYAKAEAALGKLTELSLNDAEILVLLGEAKSRANKAAEALQLFERAISLNQAANRPVPAEWAHAASLMKAKLVANAEQR